MMINISKLEKAMNKLKLIKLILINCRIKKIIGRINLFNLQIKSSIGMNNI